MTQKQINSTIIINIVLLKIICMPVWCTNGDYY